MKYVWVDSGVWHGLSYLKGEEPNWNDFRLEGQLDALLKKGLIVEEKKKTGGDK